MTHCLRLPVLALLAASLGATACAESDGDPSSSNESAVTESTIRLFATTDRRIAIDVAGSGAMPVGSQCIPGHESYSWDRPSKYLTASRCVMDAAGVYVIETASATGLATPFPFDQQIARAEVERLEVALTKIVASPKRTCETGAKMSMQVSISRGDGAFDLYYDDFYACQANYLGAGHASGIEPALETLRSVAAPLRFNRSTTPLPTTAGNAVWEADAQFSITNAGSGDVPLGSECAPGFEQFNVHAKHKSFYWKECVATTPGDPRLRVVNRSGYMSDEELAAFKAVTEAATTTASPICQPRSFVTIQRMSAENWKVDTFVDEAASCRAFGYATTNLDGVLAALRSMIPSP